MTTKNNTREALAAYAHEAWGGWMRYMFTIGTLLNDQWMSPQPGQRAKLLLPEWAVERWQRQMNTPYAELPESEKASDRDEADKILAIIGSQTDMPASIKDDIGLCAAAVVLAYYRKTHDHILADDDTRNAALRVEHWLGRR